MADLTADFNFPAEKLEQKIQSNALTLHREHQKFRRNGYGTLAALSLLATAMIYNSAVQSEPDAYLKATQTFFQFVVGSLTLAASSVGIYGVVSAQKNINFYNSQIAQKQKP